MAFAEGTYNPVAQMGNPEVMDLFDRRAAVDAIQWETLAEEMERSVEYTMSSRPMRAVKIYSAVKRG